MPQQGLQQPRLRRRLPVVGLRRVPVGVERVLFVPQRLGEPPAQHRDLGLHLVGNADHLEFAAPPRGPGIVLHLERGTHRIRGDDALQFRRQRGDREFGVLELFARICPFFLTGEREAFPQLGIVAVADRRTCKVLQRPLGMADQDAGDRMHHQHAGLLAPLIGLGEDEVGHPSRLLIHPARHVEISKLEAGLRLLPRRRGGRRFDQRIQPREKFLFPVLAPFVGVEQRPHRRGGAFGRDVGGRQRQSAGPSKHHLVGADLGVDVVGVRMHDHAVHGFQQR